MHVLPGGPAHQGRGVPPHVNAVDGKVMIPEVLLTAAMQPPGITHMTILDAELTTRPFDHYKLSSSNCCLIFHNRNGFFYSSSIQVQCLQRQRAQKHMVPGWRAFSH